MISVGKVGSFWLRILLPALFVAENEITQQHCCRHRALWQCACEQKPRNDREAEDRSVFQALRSSLRRRHGLIEAMLRSGLLGPRDETRMFPLPFSPLHHPASPSLPLRWTKLFVSTGAHRSLSLDTCGRWALPSRADHLSFKIPFFV